MPSAPKVFVTEYWPKPIPDRSCDWSATYGDYDLDDPIGWGATEEEAIRDLMDQLPDRCALLISWEEPNGHPDTPPR